MKLIFNVLIFLIASSCCATKPIADDAKNETSNIYAENENLTQNDINIDKAPETEIETETQIQNDSLVDTTLLEDIQTDYITINNAFDHSLWDTLLKKHVSNSGNVDYKGFKNDRSKLKDYITSLGEQMPKESWSKNDKLAYWINAYNALTIDLIIQNYPLQSIKDIKDPWDQRLWKLGDKWYNLNEIEHDILRKMDEPRIHFGIVCASYSCPKLLNEAFIASTLDEQLTAATTSFLADDTRNKISEDKIELSKIFQWFAKDFKQNGSLIDFLNQYTEVKISEDAKKRYLDYNWDLNEQ